MTEHLNSIYQINPPFILAVYEQRRTGRGVRGVRMTSLASDSKLRRTVNLRRKKGKKRAKRKRKKKKEGKQEKKGKTKRKRRKRRKREKKTLSVYISLSVLQFTHCENYTVDMECIQMSVERSSTS